LFKQAVPTAVTRLSNLVKTELESTSNADRNNTARVDDGDFSAHRSTEAAASSQWRIFILVLGPTIPRSHFSSLQFTVGGLFIVVPQWARTV
jgi:hypothetical protein